MTADCAAVDDQALKWRHQGSADDGHHEEGSAERCVFKIYVFQSSAVNRREHQAHEEADADEAVKSCFSDYQNRSKRTNCSADAENSEQAATVDIFHQEGGDKTAAEEKAHRYDVVILRRGFANTKIISVMDDKSPHHDLRRDVENLCDDTFTIDAVAP